jgi:SAM-dependent methyltransferase
MSGSYTSGGQSFQDIVRQTISARRFYAQKIESQVTEALTHIEQVEQNVFEHYGIRLRNLDILELGPGQLFGQTAYLARHNRVTGVDRDLLVRGFNPLHYLKMLTINGPMRTSKTIGRKVLGFDRRYRKELCRRLGIARLPPFSIRHAGGADLPVEDRSFDFVYSRAVFQHVGAPCDLLREMARALKPGGVLYVSLQPYTSPTACLDPRVLYGGIENEIGLWPHLRPELQERVRPNAWVNKLRIRDWEGVFHSVSEGAKFIVTPTDGRYIALATSLKQAGHLEDYSVEELTAGALDVMFQLPK